MFNYTWLPYIFLIWNEPEVAIAVHDHRMKTIMSLEQLTTIGPIPRRHTGRSLQRGYQRPRALSLGAKDLGEAPIYTTWQSRQREGNPLPDEGDWLLPGSGKALDTAIRENRRSLRSQPGAIVLSGPIQRQISSC